LQLTLNKNKRSITNGVLEENLQRAGKEVRSRKSDLQDHVKLQGEGGGGGDNEANY
jgi:hypothetical protein